MAERADRPAHRRAPGLRPGPLRRARARRSRGRLPGRTAQRLRDRRQACPAGLLLSRLAEQGLNEQGLDDQSGRFGESAAILLADLCLVWAGQLLRDSGLPPAALARGWPRYDTLRGELAVGQFADLVNDARRAPTLEAVL